jgi:translation initiation factor 4A
MVTQIAHTEYKEWDSMPIFSDEANDNTINLLRGIIACGFETPSEIQSKVVVPMSQGRDIIANANSGTGKTGAFTIGSLSRIDPTLNKPQIVVISPNHELAQQTDVVIKSIGEFMAIKTELCIGKSVSVEENKYNLSKGRHIIVATPGRLLQLLREKSFDLSYVKVVVLDEADRLLSGEFSGDICGILKTLQDVERPQKLQVGIFSATMSPLTFEMIRPYVTDPFSVVLEKEQLTLEGINQYFYEINAGDSRDKQLQEKAAVIEIIHSVKQISQTIIYVNNVDTGLKLHELLRGCGLETALIHGRLSPSERESIIMKFRKCDPRILITTDLLSRGFNSQHVSLVINVDIPFIFKQKTSEIDEDRIAEYLHRIGRSGRYGRRGVAINLVGNKSESFRLQRIAEFYGKEIAPLPDNLESVL